ncbi:MAG: glutathione S-transferase [Candidatus Puniceispirillum sp.]
MPVLWSFRRCPYAMRARLAIDASQQQVQLREILLRDKPDAFVAISPKATVPVLQCDDGNVLEESRDIMFWALESNDPEGWLDIWHQAPTEVTLFFDRLDGSFKADLDRYKYASRYDADAALKHRDAGVIFIAELDNILAQQTALSGAKLGLLDYACLPFIRQFRIADSEWFDQQNWPHIHPWLQSFFASARFERVMQKYSPWRDGEQGVDFPPQCI